MQAARRQRQRKLRFAVIVPVLNAEKEAPAFLAALRRQTLAPDIFLVIDSSSTDRSVEIFENAGAKVHVIPRSEFNHADTRQMAVEWCCKWPAMWISPCS